MKTSKIDSEALKERVRWAINFVAEQHNLSNEKLAKILGYSTSTINSYRRKITVPGLEFFVFFIHEYNFDLEWFASGQDEPFLGARTDYPAVCGPESSSRFTNASKDGSFVYVPQMGGRISAGGCLVSDDTVEIKLAFRKEWIHRKGNPKQMAVIKVSGDSMEPTLISGDLVLIDQSQNHLDPQGGIYAIAVEDVIMIKRLQAEYPSNKVQIISDNFKYRAVETDMNQVKINGRVIWFGRELER